MGRNPDCVISLPDVVGISGLHGTICYKDGAFYIKDEESTNGIQRNNVSLTAEEALQENTDYMLGEATLTYDAQGVTVPTLPSATPAQPAAAPAAPKPSRPTNAPKAKPVGQGGQRSPKPLADTIIDYSQHKKVDDGFVTTYAIIIIIVSFLAGMTLRHWKDTGGFFPKEAFQERPTEVTKVTKSATPSAGKAKPSPAPSTAAPTVTPTPATTPSYTGDDSKRTALGTAK